jgi:hypothetical protein
VVSLGAGDSYVCALDVRTVVRTQLDEFCFLTTLRCFSAEGAALLCCLPTHCRAMSQYTHTHDHSSHNQRFSESA